MPIKYNFTEKLINKFIKKLKRVSFGPKNASITPFSAELLFFLNQEQKLLLTH